MMDKGVWIHSDGDGSVIEATKRHLEESGFHVVSRSVAAVNGPGIVFFRRLTQELLDCLLEICKGRTERVLAVSCGDVPLSSAETWQILQTGVSDVLVQNAVHGAQQIASRLERWATIDEVVFSPLVQKNLVGQSPLWITTIRQVVEIACFTNSSVLITGESGTGKELVARLVHTLDTRRDKRNLVIVDCTTIVPELSGSEFFGHEKGAFTGAVIEREGAFSLANNGTLFLDEIGELLPSLQSELLRVVEQGTYKRVGSNAWRETHFRLVSATNRDLYDEQTNGRFRHDLYHRITGWVCKLPPLRARAEDILALVNHFFQQAFPNQESPELDDAVKEYLLRREYPGNVRDLKQLVARVAHRHVGPGPITVGDLPEEERPQAYECVSSDWQDPTLRSAVHRAMSAGIGLKDIGRMATETAIQIALTEANGNLQEAARRLGVSDRALQLRRAQQNGRILAVS